MLMRSLKKIYKNKWMYLALNIGLILALMVAIIIPMFSRAAQEELYKKTLDNYSNENGRYSGTVYYKYAAGSNTSYILPEIKNFYTLIQNTSNLSEMYNMEIISEKHLLEKDGITFWEAEQDIESNNAFFHNPYNFIAIKGIEENINLLKGRMCSGNPDESGIYEVIVDNYTFNSNFLEMNTIYHTTIDSNAEKSIINALGSAGDKIISFKIVGVYELKEDDFWSQGIWNLGGKTLVFHEEAYIDMMNKSGKNFHYIGESYLDYSKISFNELIEIPKVYEDVSSTIKKKNNHSELYSTPLGEVIDEMNAKVQNTKLMLFTIFSPIIFMLICYILMISKIITNRDSNEIALLKSRGATVKNIVSSYLIQYIIMGAIALVVSPILGQFIVKAMGSVSDFLEFNNNGSFQVYTLPSDYLIGITLIFLFVIANILPIYILSRKTIVEAKRSDTRVNLKSKWKKYFIDILLIILSLYSFYNFKLRENMINSLANESLDMPIDPMIYLIIATMCIAITLLFLRIYPVVLKVIFKIGKKSWSAENYYILNSATREFHKKEYIMIFLMLTLSIGIFNMKAARKMNTEGSDNISYKIGADIVIKEKWDTVSTKRNKLNDYSVEPSFNKFLNINGVIEGTKVIQSDSAKLDVNNYDVSSNIMGIIPQEFGNVAWKRDDLFTMHWNNYLNALTENPEGILIGRNLIEKGLELGDKTSISIYSDVLGRDLNKNSAISIEKSYTIPVTVVGIIDYWPTWDGSNGSNMIIANYTHLYNNMMPIPYDVWLKTEDDANGKNIYNELITVGSNIINFEDTNAHISDFKNDLFIKTINAAYTFAFIITLIITFTGFIVYWTLNLSERELQFGIIRSLGICKNRVYKMLLIEQCLLTGVSLIVGTLIGDLVFKMFNPLTSVESIDTGNLLPEIIYYSTTDYLRVFSLVGLMIIILMIIIKVYISRLKINKAIKLGED